MQAMVLENHEIRFDAFNDSSAMQGVWENLSFWSTRRARAAPNYI